jgi:hypothetical protein
VHLPVLRHHTPGGAFQVQSHQQDADKAETLAVIYVHSGLCAFRSFLVKWHV